MTIWKPTSEHSPLSQLDEYPVHQIPRPIRVVATSDARAYERYWFTAQDLAGTFVLMVGIGFYPNLNTVDGYAAISVGTSHTTVRAHALMTDERTEISVGPIRAEVIEPFREWHITVDHNDQDLEVDIHWYDTKRAVFHEMSHSPSGGRPGQITAGYESFGRVAGRIDVKGQQLHLSPDTTNGSRDHHWGTRNGVGGRGHLEPHARTSHFGQWVEFDEFGLWGSRALQNLGSPTPGAINVIRVERELAFDPATHHFIGGTVHNHLEDGSVKTVTYEQFPHRVVYLRTGMYMGPDDRAEPETGYFQGEYVGDLVVGGSHYDIADPMTRIRIGGFDDHLVRASCDGETAVGLIEVMNPVAYEMCRDRAPGYSFARS